MVCRCSSTFWRKDSAVDFAASVAAQFFPESKKSWEAVTVGVVEMARGEASRRAPRPGRPPVVGPAVEPAPSPTPGARPARARVRASAKGGERSCAISLKSHLGVGSLDPSGEPLFEDHVERRDQDE